MARSQIMLCLAVVALIAVVAQACVYDSECGVGGRCINGACQGTVECHANIDCLPKGVYMECSNGKCVKSSHKICINDDDCKKNWIHKHCKDNRCT